VGLLGDFFLGKANFGSAFMRELKQALSILLKLVLGNRLVARLPKTEAQPPAKSPICISRGMHILRMD
jgi:hypothetical protein